MAPGAPADPSLPNLFRLPQLASRPTTTPPPPTATPPPPAAPAPPSPEDELTTKRPAEGSAWWAHGSGKYVPRHSARPEQGTIIRRRRWPRRILVGANVIVAVAIVTSGSVVGYAYWRLGQISRVHLSALIPLGHDPQSKVAVTTTTLPGSPGSDGGAGPGATTPPSTIPLPVLPAETFLIVGSDTRAGLDQKGDSAFGSPSVQTGARSDTIILARVVPSTKQIALLSIPRDTYLDIPGLGMQKINAALNTSPNLLINVIKQQYGIDVNHYIDVDFDSFKDIADALGGVKIYFPTPVQDVNAGLYIGQPGCVNLTGNLALAFVRSREYRYYLPDEGWIQEKQSDLARIQRQQMFIRLLAAKAQSEGLGNPIRLDKVIGSLTKNLAVDDTLSNQDLLSLASTFRNIDPNNIVGWTMPATAQTLTTPQGPDDILVPEQDADEALVDQFLAFGSGPSATTAPTVVPTESATPSTTVAASSPVTHTKVSHSRVSHSRVSKSRAGKSRRATTPSTLPPASIQIVVSNGSGIAGQAGTTGTALTKLGFDVTGLEDSPPGNRATVVQYSPGGLAAARTVAAHIGGKVKLAEVSNGTGPDVVEVVTGTQTVVRTKGVSHPHLGPGTTTTTTSTTLAPTTTATTVPSTTSTTYVLPGTPKSGAPSCSN